MSEPIVTHSTVHCDTPGCGFTGIATDIRHVRIMIDSADAHARENGHWVKMQAFWYTENGPDPRDLISQFADPKLTGTDTRYDG